MRIETPASKDDPPPSPSVLKNEAPNKGKTLAKTLLKRALPARREAAY